MSFISRINAILTKQICYFYAFKDLFFPVGVYKPSSYFLLIYLKVYQNVELHISEVAGVKKA